MRIFLSTIIRFVACTGLSVLAVSAQAQDFDGDGFADLLTTQITAEQKILWESRSSDSGGEGVNRTFGIAGDVPVPAQWLEPGIPNLATVREDGNKVVWKVLLDPDRNEIVVREFGKRDSAVVAGADFNADGVADPAVVNVQGGKLRWTIRPELFARERSRERTLSFGKENDRLFFFDPDGGGDHLAVVTTRGKRAVIRHRALRSKRTFTVRRLPKRAVRIPHPRPFPIRQEDGSDLIGIVTSDRTDTTLTILSPRSERLLEKSFTGKGDTAVGDFVPDEPGEEVALVLDGELSYVNPITGNEIAGPALAGQIVDEVTVALARVTPTPSPPTPVPPLDTDALRACTAPPCAPR